MAFSKPLLFALALCLSVGGVHADPTAAHHADATPMSQGQFRVTGAPAGQARVADIYRAVMRERLAPMFVGKTAALNQLMQDPARLWELARFMDLISSKEAHPGLWEFQQPAAGQTWPSRATQVVDLSTPDQYVAERIVHCDDSAATCEAFAREMAQGAPEPFQPRTTQAYAQWRERILREPCEVAGKPSMPPPPYPHESMRRGETGIVRVGVIANACGRVRGVWLERSSRHSALDRAALAGARRWRLEIPADQVPGLGFTSVEPVIFTF
jgi:TonB family protein